MAQIAHDSSDPFVFSYGGRTYIVPPKEGGKFEFVSTPFTDEYGFTVNKRELKKTGETSRNFLDVPDNAVHYLMKASVRKRHKNKIRIITDAMSQIDHERAELRAATAALAAERLAFEDKLAVVSVTPSPKAGKAKR